MVFFIFQIVRATESADGSDGIAFNRHVTVERRFATAVVDDPIANEHVVISGCSHADAKAKKRNRPEKLMHGIISAKSLKEARGNAGRQKSKPCGWNRRLDD